MCAPAMHPGHAASGCCLITTWQSGAPMHHLPPHAPIPQESLTIPPHTASLPPAGNSSYSQRSNLSLYTTTPAANLKLAWYIGSNIACSATLRTMCEIPESQYPCPVNTPPVAVYDPNAVFCKWLTDHGPRQSMPLFGLTELTRLTNQLAL